MNMLLRLLYGFGFVGFVVLTVWHIQRGAWVWAALNAGMGAIILALFLALLTEERSP